MGSTRKSHWVGLAEPEKYFGFIYLITDLTSGLKYVGKKQYWMGTSKIRGCKGKSYDKGSPKWNEKCWKESGWRTYKGSSKILTEYMKLNKDHKYSYEILKQCRSRASLNYHELKELWSRDVLTKELEGQYEYFNVSIGAIKYRPPKEN